VKAPPHGISFVSSQVVPLIAIREGCWFDSSPRERWGKCWNLARALAAADFDISLDTLQKDIMSSVEEGYFIAKTSPSSSTSLIKIVFHMNGVV
jgi:hypothetical protein